LLITVLNTLEWKNMVEVLKEITMATHQHSISQHQHPTLRNYFLASRPMFLVASLLPVIFGTAVGYQLVSREGGKFDLLAFFLALVAVTFVNLGINVLNDVYDDINGTDRINKHAVIPFTGGSRVIQENILSRDQMRNWSYLLLALSVVAGFLLVLYKGYVVLWLGLAGLFFGIAYSLPPIKLSSRGLGESAILLAVGVLPVTGAAWLQTGEFSWMALFLSLPIGLWVTNIIMVNEVPDSEADEASGKRTLAVRFGDKATAGLYLMANLAAAALVCVVAIFGPLPLAAMILPVVLLMPAVMTTNKIRCWQEDRQAFVGGIKFNIATYLINIVWLTAWVIAM
jgi:1,4-dihydroxy-2-naphthoate octaprenyltransferase